MKKTIMSLLMLALFLTSIIGSVVADQGLAAEVEDINPTSISAKNLDERFVLNDNNNIIRVDTLYMKINDLQYIEGAKGNWVQLSVKTIPEQTWTLMYVNEIDNLVYNGYEIDNIKVGQNSVLLSVSKITEEPGPEQYAFGKYFYLNHGDIAFVGNSYGEYHVYVTDEIRYKTCDAMDPNAVGCSAGSEQIQVRVNWREGGEDFWMTVSGDKVDVNDEFELELVGKYRGVYKFTTKELSDSVPHYAFGKTFSVAQNGVAMVGDTYGKYVIAVTDEEVCSRTACEGALSNSCTQVVCSTKININWREGQKDFWMNNKGDKVDVNGEFELELIQLRNGLYNFKTTKIIVIEPVTNFKIGDSFKINANEKVNIEDDYSLYVSDVVRCTGACLPEHECDNSCSVQISVYYAGRSEEAYLNTKGDDEEFFGAFTLELTKSVGNTYYFYVDFPRDETRPGKTCRDSDGGLNFNQAGTVTVCDYETQEEPGSNSEVGCSLHKDVCLDDNTALEYYCLGNELSFERYECETECHIASCIQEGSTSPVDGIAPTEYEDGAEYACAPGCKEVKEGCLCPKIRIRTATKGYIVSGSGSDVEVDEIKIRPGDKNIRVSYADQEFEVGSSDLSEGVNFPIKISGKETDINIRTDSDTLQTFIEVDGENTRARTRTTVITDDEGMAVKTSTGKSRIKIMPAQASERAREVLGNLFEEVEIREVNGNAYYFMSEEKAMRILGFIPVTGTYSAEVDAESGNMISSNKPWYSGISSTSE